MLRIGFVAMLACLSIPMAARAQDASADSLDDEARTVFQAGQGAFRDGRFADALTDFERSYELSHRPALLYNIGECHDHLRHDADALTAFEAYLAAVPDAPSRQVTEARIAVLREAVAQHTSAPPQEATTPTVETPSEATPPPPQTPPRVEASSSDPTGWILLAVGGAIAIGGAVLVGVAFGDIGTAEGARGVTYASVRDAADRAPIESGVGWAALGVGVALALVGVVVALTTGPSSSDRQQASLRIGAGGLALEGTF